MILFQTKADSGQKRWKEEAGGQVEAAVEDVSFGGAGREVSICADEELSACAG